jgi:hypothetical protein
MTVETVSVGAVELHHADGDDWAEYGIPLATIGRSAGRLRTRQPGESLNGGDTVSFSDLTTLSTFRSTADAQIAKGVLDEAGIESMVRSDNAGGMYPAIAGADLLVRSEDREKALDALHRGERNQEPT